MARKKTGLDKLSQLHKEGAGRFLFLQMQLDELAGRVKKLETAVFK